MRLNNAPTFVFEQQVKNKKNEKTTNGADNDRGDR